MTPTAADADRIAARLLDAHVAHVVARLRGPGFAELVGDGVDHLLEQAGGLTLDDVMTREQVRAVAMKYVSTFSLPGAIPEVAGEVAARVRRHPANDALVGDVVPRRHAEALIEKVASNRPLREAIVASVAENAAVQAWLGNYLYSLATGAVATNRRLISKLPGASSALSLGDRLTKPIVREADQRSRELAEKAAAGVLQRWRENGLTALADDDLAAALTEAWDAAEQRRMREVLAGVADDDLIDVIVIGYELWLDLRGSEYLEALIGTGIDFFFDTYGASTLAELLDEFGLGRADLVEEAMRFAPPVIETLAERGILAELVRRPLADFYASPAARDAIRADG